MGIMKAIGRIIVTLLGFSLAALTAVLVLFTLGLLWVSEATVTPAEDDIERLINAMQQAYGAVLFVATVAPSLTILPGLIAVVAGELGGIRSLLYYVATGGVAMAVLPVLSSVLGPEAGLPAVKMLAIFATSGFAAGLIYWLIAGRSS